jgi:positive phototaxis protein PixI
MAPTTASALYGESPLFGSSQTATTQQGQDQFLSFPLAIETQAMLPVGQLTEVLTLLVGQIVPIPDMPGWVLGVYNWRGEILWVIDLPQLLGLQSLHQQARRGSSAKVIVSQAQRPGGRYTHLGLAVNAVDDIIWCNSGQIESPPASVVTPGLAPFLRGYHLGDDGEMRLVLDAAAIFAQVQPG